MYKVVIHGLKASQFNAEMGHKCYYEN